ncbi:Diacylglycerol kinase catalytic domain [Arabidopsis thaliana x Arabidopsis arenosa]|uniref:Diacylglycerol kinase n=1 Tax=Arabidopsis thaliana x Arabidopsis arenosa TaxID=1240361 RepID=A0A8T1XPU3_9BRAS|nr:Diacylglycerol kinase catalytic domain [Arabidopsis thaliana x Arabidopsis arenosa]
MESPSIGDSVTARMIPRHSSLDSFGAMKVSLLVNLASIRVSKAELRQRVMLPKYLRIAIRDCILRKDDSFAASSSVAPPLDNAFTPEVPLMVFVNPKSGGRQGPLIKERLQNLISEEQVFDLTEVKPNEFIRYGLGCLEALASRGDECAKEIREKMRIVVAGGDGTVGWVLGCLGELNLQNRLPVPPVSIMPLGTGNDLSRSFGWGGSFPFAWKSAIKRTLHRASVAPISRLDSWNILITMPSGEIVDPPYSLKATQECYIDQGLEIEGEMPPSTNGYEGVFYNYFSIGMDAQVAYGFHHLRNEKPYLANGPIANKIIYSGYGCSQGWFLTHCINDPGLRGLKNIMTLHIKKLDSSEWEKVPVPKSVRAVVALNLHSYGSGRNPWGNLKQDYLEKRGFVEAQADDGLLEIFGLKQGWHASFVMVELISAKHIAQAAAIRLEIRGGDWKDAFMQMDGEPWKQPMTRDYSTFVDIKRVPHQSLVVKGD